MIAKLGSFLYERRDDLRERWATNRLLLREFWRRFSPKRLKTITLDEYCFKKGCPDSFCYWIENTLSDLGSIRIPHASGVDKFHIQFIGGRYVWKHNKGTPHWAYADNAAGVFSNIRSELNKLIEAVISGDISAIKNNRFHQTTRAKIAYLYKPDAWIPIYVHPHLEAICRYLDVPIIGSDVTDLRVGLFGYYEQVRASLPSLSTWEFMAFIYDAGIMDCALSEATSKSSRKDAWRTNSTRLQVVRPSLNEDVSSLEGSLVPVAEETYAANDDVTTPSERIEQFENKQMIGRRAEKYVNAYLKKHKNHMGITEIHSYGLQHKDGHHCDFECKKRSGGSIFIEVKGTAKEDESLITFFMSDAERQLAESNQENYFLFFVTGVLSHPKIHILRPSDFLRHLKPSEYSLKASVLWHNTGSGTEDI